MKPTLLFLSLHVFWAVSGQETFRALANGRNYRFNPREIRDSGFTSVNIYTVYSDHLGDENWRDTIFAAKFNKQGKIIFQVNKNAFYDSTIRNFYYSDGDHPDMEIVRKYDLTGTHRVWIDTITYNKEGRITEYRKRSGIGTKGSTLLTRYTYNKSGQCIKVIVTGINNSVTEYLYSKSGKEEKCIYKEGKRTVLILNEYDGRDSLVKVKSIETFGNKADSTISIYAYNDQGKLIYRSRYPSPTYYKTFPIDCFTGDREDIVYEYDSAGRKIYEASILDLDRISYTSLACTRTSYYEHGFTEENFDSKGRLWSASVYDKYTGYDRGRRYLRETYNLSSKTTTFLSKNSDLLLSIDVSENQSIGNEKYLYVYSK